MNDRQRAEATYRSGQPIDASDDGTDDGCRVKHRRCTAHSSRTGERCKRAAIRGGVVCRSHGGGAVQVRLKAQQRLDALVLPAIEALATAMKSGDVRAALRAAAMVLDRAGFPAKSSMDLKVEDCDAVLSRVLGVPVDMLP